MGGKFRDSCKENVSFVGETYCSGLASILSAKFRGNIATEEWGNSEESETLGAYLAMKQQNRSPTITVRKSGLVIHPSHHWLGASPDGLVNDPIVK